MATARRIMQVDMDAFYASVEQADNFADFSTRGRVFKFDA